MANLGYQNTHTIRDKQVGYVCLQCYPQRAAECEPVPETQVAEWDGCQHNTQQSKAETLCHQEAMDQSSEYNHRTPKNGSQTGLWLCLIIQCLFLHYWIFLCVLVYWCRSVNILNISLLYVYIPLHTVTICAFFMEKWMSFTDCPLLIFWNIIFNVISVINTEQI